MHYSHIKMDFTQRKFYRSTIIWILFSVAVQYSHASETQVGQFSDTYENFISMLVSISENGIDKAVIISKENGTQLTNNGENGLPVSAFEGQEIAEVFKSGVFTLFQEKGITIGGVTYSTWIELPQPHSKWTAMASCPQAGTIIIKTAEALPYILAAHCVEAESRSACLTSMDTVIHLLRSLTAGPHFNRK